MNGNRIIVDSNIVIYLSQNTIELDYSKYGNYGVSIISYIEVYSYEFENESEKRIVGDFFDNVEIIDVIRPIAEQAILYRMNKNKKIKLPDATILATARYLAADLLTNNLSDFKGVDEAVYVLGIDDLRV